MASGLALGFVALAGAGLALKAGRSRAEEPTLRCPNAGAKRCPAARGESVVTSIDVGGPLMKDGPLPEHMQVGSTEAEINAQELTTKTSAANDAQRPAEGPNAMAVATTADTPALASEATGSALTVSQTARLEPVPSGLVVLIPGEAAHQNEVMSPAVTE